MSTTQSTTTMLPLVNLLAELQTDKLGLAASVVESIGNDTGGLLRQVVDVRPDGTVLVGTAISYNQGQPVAFSHQGVEVEVPSALLESVGGLGPLAAVMGLMPMEGETFGILNGSVSGGLQAGVISLDIYVNGTAVRDLTAPILLTLQGTPVARPSCAFWDEVEMVWSTQGLTVVAVENGTIVCSTTHLSIFSSILFTFTCSNAGAIYSLRGLESLGSRPWFGEPAAILNWVTLLVGILLLLWAHGADRRHLDRMKVVRSMQELQKSDKRQEHVEHIEHVAEEVGAFLRSGLSSAALSQMIRKETGFGIKELKVLYNRMGHTMLHSRAEAVLRRLNAMSCGRRLVIWYALNCRWINFVFLSSKSSCMVRCAVLLGKIYSSWAVSAVFYGSTAIAPGQEDGCTPPEGFLDQLVRSAVVMLVSVFFGALPFLVMLRLFHCGTPGDMAGKRFVFWGFLFLYFVFCILTVCIFIALVGTADATKWFFTSALDIAVSLVQPVVIAQLLLVATLCQKGGGHPHAAHSALPWPAAESLENYEVTLQALNVIDRYEKKKRKRYLATVEVLGLDRVLTFQRAMDEDSFRVAGSTLRGTEEHVLLVCVYRNSVKPDALCGTAKIAFRRFINGSFSGKLPLRTKGELPLEVFVGLTSVLETKTVMLQDYVLEENLCTLDSSPGLSDAVAEQVAELPQALEELDAQEVPEVVVEVSEEDPEPELEDVPAEAAAIPEAKSEPLVVARLDEDAEEQPAEDLPAGAEPTQQTADSAPEAQDPMPHAVVPSETVQIPIEMDDPPEQLAI